MVPQVNHEKRVLSQIIYHNSQAIKCIYFPDKYCKKFPTVFWSKGTSI